MTNPIPPSIGRVVLVRHTDYQGDVPAVINAVHSNECISVCAMPFNSSPHPVTSITYSEDHDTSGFHVTWHWMEYQLKVASERDPVTGNAPGAAGPS